MSTTLLYHAFGIRTFRYVRMVIESGCLFIHVVKKTVRKRCLVCRSKNTVYVGENVRSIRLLPIGFRPVRAIMHLKVIRCKDCGAERQEPIEDAPERRSYSKRFAAHVIELVKIATLLDAAQKLGVGWDLVKDIVKQDLRRQVKRRKYRDIRLIAIDEIAAKKRHHYLTIVTDLTSGLVVFAAEGKDADCLNPFFHKLRRSRATLVAAAMDMSGAYEKAIHDYNASLPQGVPPCKIVTDHFHAVKQMNEALDDIRKDEAQKLEEQGRKLLKGSRFLLFFGSKKFSEDPRRLVRLKTLLDGNVRLMQAWLLKESFGLIWKQDSKDEAIKFVDDWCQQASQLGDPHINKVINMVQRHRFGIINYYDFPISSAPLEGINNKIKVLKRRAYGYRDMEFFILRILTIHETKYRLSGI